MNQKQKNRIGALLTVLCFVVLFVLNTVFIVEHQNHHCTGESCSVCLQLRKVSQQLGGTFFEKAQSLWGLTLLLVFLAAAGTMAGAYETTPVGNKVKLNC